MENFRYNSQTTVLEICENKPLRKFLKNVSVILTEFHSDSINGSNYLMSLLNLIHSVPVLYSRNETMKITTCARVCLFLI